MHTYMKERWSNLLFLHQLCVLVIGGGSERGVDNVVYKYGRNDRICLIINKMKRINQDMGLCI